MAANSFFLGGIDLADTVLARVDERDAISTYATLIEDVRARCGPEVAALFAEPVKGTNRATGLPNIAWYCPHEGTPFALRQLEAAGRQPVIERLRQRLLAFSSLFSDSRNGPVLASWLHIISPDSILAVGGQPVLKNWGMLPASVAASEEARDSHFRNGVGVYLPNVPTPPFAEIEASSFTARMTQLADRESARAARTQPSPSEKPMSTTSAVPPPVPPPVTHRTSRPWIAPFVACLLAGGVLAALVFGNILRYPDRHASDDETAIDAQRETNRALRDRLDDLRRVANSPDVCQAPPGDPSNPHHTDVRPLLPPLPKQTKVTPANPTDPPGSLAASLERSTVLVLTEHMLGSGFFVSDRYIVTNHHVVGEDTAAQVASRALGGIVSARVVAVGGGTERGTQDIAVLEIDPKPGTSYLQLGVAPERLQQVTAAGYPGAVLETIQKSADLPEANFTQGIVTSHQTQDPDGIATIIHTAQIGHGNSGGPLVDSGGCAVGINSWLAPDEMDERVFSTYFQALDASELKRFLQAKSIDFKATEQPCKPIGPPTDAPIPTADKR